LFQSVSFESTPGADYNGVGFSLIYTADNEIGDSEVIVTFFLSEDPVNSFNYITDHKKGCHETNKVTLSERLSPEENGRKSLFTKMFEDALRYSQFEIRHLKERTEKIPDQVSNITYLNQNESCPKIIPLKKLITLNLSSRFCFDISHKMRAHVTIFHYFLEKYMLNIRRENRTFVHFFRAIFRKVDIFQFQDQIWNARSTSSSLVKVSFETTFSPKPLD
jgi:hypothetical protein